ncbi:MAG TPA: M67 family metallopeptidase [Acidimicrobiales bacterium]|nr:M67 family metallopeptidase [Acidimicrobiales bacterium]HUX03666.1 M67 family metallopeptidase [Acidimicrobiales bacterium]
MLTLSPAHIEALVATSIRALPNEGCGLLLGLRDQNGGVVTEVVPSHNVADSAKVYEIDSKVLLRTYRRADDEGLEVLGVFHSHTHSEAYPSPTDIAQAPDPVWHYVLVSLRDQIAVVRSFRIVNGSVTEEELVR